MIFYLINNFLGNADLNNGCLEQVYNKYQTIFSKVLLGLVFSGYTVKFFDKILRNA